MPRDTLIDYFDNLSRAKGPFLVYDDGFRARSHLYAEVGRVARGFAKQVEDAVRSLRFTPDRPVDPQRKPQLSS